MVTIGRYVLFYTCPLDVDRRPSAGLSYAYDLILRPYRLRWGDGKGDKCIRKDYSGPRRTEAQSYSAMARLYPNVATRPFFAGLTNSHPSGYESRPRTGTASL